MTGEAPECDCQDKITELRAWIQTLYAKLHDLQEELDQAQADKRRLDWCEQDNNSKDMGNHVELRTRHTEYAGLREAIDAAIARK